MKKYLKYAGIVSMVLAIVALIMMLTVKPFEVDGKVAKDYKPTYLLFGHTEKTFGIKVTIDAAPAALFAFLLLIASIVILALGIVLPVVGKSMSPKVAGIVNLVAVVCLVLAGILVFCSRNSFADANDLGKSFKDNVDMTAGYVIAGILAIVAGCVAAAPAVTEMLDK